jgi:hypothetical protein
MIRTPVPGRECGRCTMCCKTVAVEELAKPAGEWCTHCSRSAGCAIYETRPAGCREFFCEWMLSPELGPEWKPDRARFALGVSDKGHLTVGADPGFPFAWRQPPYHEALRRWARELAARPGSAWPAIDVWVGSRCILILPDGEHDMGFVAAREEIVIDVTMTAAGPVFTAAKLPAAR